MVDNLTIRSQNFFSTTIINHSTNSSLQGNLSQSFVFLQLFEKVTGLQLFNFSVNDGVQFNTTTNGVGLLNLPSGLRNVSFVNISGGYFNTSNILNISVLGNSTFNNSCREKVLTTNSKIINHEIRINSNKTRSSTKY